MPAYPRNITARFMKAGHAGKALYFFAFLLLILLVVKGLTPLSARKALDRLVKADSVQTGKQVQYPDYREIMPLVRERSYKEALLQLAENDSINLIINLQDSVVCLTIHGVIIHEVRMTHARIDPFLERLPNPVYTRLFSRPVLILNERSSIIKEPIVEREAPKDTIEAMLNAYMPDTLIQNPAFVQMELEHHIHIILEQDASPAIRDKTVKALFRAGFHVRRWVKDVAACFTLKMPEYEPVIRIRIPADDLRAVFRALPSEARVVLYYK